MSDAAATTPLREFEIIPEGEYVCRLTQVTLTHLIYEIQEGDFKGQKLLMKHPGNVRIGTQIRHLPLVR